MLAATSFFPLFIYLFFLPLELTDDITLMAESKEEQKSLQEIIK